MEICDLYGRYLLIYSSCNIKLTKGGPMTKKPIEDYQTSLTEEQKKILDDSPPKVVQHLFDYVAEHGMPSYFNLRVLTKVNGRFSFERFEGPAAVNAIDYLKFLVRNGYKDLADAG